MAKQSVLDQIRQLDEQKRKLLDDAKAEALQKAEDAISELNELGYSYRLVEGGSSPRKQPSGSKGASRGTIQDAACGICGFKTVPPHDKRAHRSQTEKRPFSNQELKDRGLEKV